ncbi:uncharacterized protein [Ptychodera flava]|uniref:uncharacterized protein n=1 Tax=Ptychodera flava TaxID=63121 RepID=UPI00396A15A7
MGRRSFQVLVIFLVIITSEGVGPVTQSLVIPVEEHEEVVLQLEVKSSFPFTDDHYIYTRALAGKNEDNLNMLTNPKISLNTSELVETTFGGYSMTFKQGIYEHVITVVINEVSKKRDEGDWQIHTIIANKDSKKILENTYRFALAVQCKDSETKRKGKGRKRCKGSGESKSRNQRKRLLRRMKKKNL